MRYDMCQIKVNQLSQVRIQQNNIPVKLCENIVAIICEDLEVKLGGEIGAQLGVEIRAKLAEKRKNFVNEVHSN